MSDKIVYDNLSFDSGWEKDYYILLKNNPNVIKIIYQPKAITDLVARKQYTPDFIYVTKDTVSLVEIKSTWNPYSSGFQDKMIHKEMKAKSRDWLKAYFIENGITNITDKTILKYEKLKKLKKGFVDFDFKPPTAADHLREKVKIQEEEIKVLKKFQKDVYRYLNYNDNIANGKKLTKAQQDWYLEFQKELANHH